MSGFLFDITALVEVLRAAPSRVFLRKLAQVATADRWTTAITVGDLLYAARRTNDAGVMTDTLKLIAAVRVASFDVASAGTYGKLAASTQWAGAQPLSANDLMNAAVARTLDLTLVTRRPAVFAQIPQLRVEDWTAGLEPRPGSCSAAGRQESSRKG